jgi:hypothetical protein
MTPSDLPPTTKGTGPEYIRRASEVLGAAFSDDGYFLYCIRSEDGIEDHVPITAERRRLSFESRMKDRIDAGFELVEAGDWAGVALWCVTDCLKMKKKRKPFLQ